MEYLVYSLAIRLLLLANHPKHHSSEAAATRLTS
jgi:hypothetical protein